MYQFVEEAMTNILSAKEIIYRSTFRIPKGIREMQFLFQFQL